jgi:glycine oxidase
MQRATDDVLIIGGGVIGCAVAWMLARRGLSVTLLEREEIGGQASGVAAGLLAPLGPLAGPGALADLVLTGFAGFPDLVDELEQATGLHLGYACTGALRIARHSGRVDHLRKRWQNWQPLGLHLSWLDGDAARQQEPLLAGDICAAVYAPQEAQVDAAQVTRAFARIARQSGASLLTHQEVCGFTCQSGRVEAVHTVTGDTFACGQVILACGAWTGRYSAWLDMPLPIEPLHGQVLVCAQTDPPLRSIIFGEGLYLIPRGSGIIVGATRARRGFDSSITAEGTDWLLSGATRLVPQLAGHQPLSVRAGLRPVTPDARPILGKLPTRDNVLIAAGHNSLGILLSGVTAHCIAELLITGQTPELIRPVGVERFTSS